MPVSVDPAANVLPIDVDLYMEIHESGALRNRRVELVDGFLIEMTPPSEEHFVVTALLGRHFVLGLADRPEYLAAQQGGIVANERSVPEPDLIVMHRRRLSDVTPVRRGRRLRRPVSQPELLAEVSLTSLRWDLGRKRRLYAEAGVPEYWVVDIAGEVLIVHRDPSEGDYRTITRHGRGEPVAPAHLPVPAFDIASALDLGD